MLKLIVKGDYGEGKKGFFGWFNCMFEKSMYYYIDSVGGILCSMGCYLVLYLIIVVGMVYLFVCLLSFFLLDEDQGVFMIMVQLLVGVMQECIQKVFNEVMYYYLIKEKNNVELVFVVNGFGFVGCGQNIGIVFVFLKDWVDCLGEENKVEVIIMCVICVFL